MTSSLDEGFIVIDQNIPASFVVSNPVNVVDKTAFKYLKGLIYPWICICFANVLLDFVIKSIILLKKKSLKFNIICTFVHFYIAWLGEILMSQPPQARVVHLMDLLM